MGDYDCGLFWDTLDDEVVDQMLNLLFDGGISVSAAPRTGLMMMTMKDGFDKDVHLGEVLVTDARVICRGVEGFGLMAGEFPRKALARAVAEAVLRSTDASAVKRRLTKIILGQEHHRAHRL